MLGTTIKALRLTRREDATPEVPAVPRASRVSTGATGATGMVLPTGEAGQTHELSSAAVVAARSTHGARSAAVVATRTTHGGRSAAVVAARSPGEARSSGRVAIDLTGDRASKRGFLFGAAGQRQVAETLEKVAGDRVLFLHHRRRGSGSTGGEIDHIAIAPSGVWVIDAHHYAGAKVRVWVTGGLVGPPEREQLVIRGRDHTPLVDGLAWQEAAVRRMLSPYGVRVRAMLCFLDADLPMFALPTIRGYPVLGPRDTGRRLRQGGPFDADQREEIREALASALDPA